ncbi:MAG: TetR/AcrR family transcriptional regulator [Acidobacteria bacterium]|nr:TetR/AcrR family transcriptional regulator [Acidobacteriota bacterium]
MKTLRKKIKAAEGTRHTQIYRAAATLFCARGYDATTMSAVADAVGVTKAALYYFFPGGKQELLYAVMSFGLDRLEEHVSTPARACADAETRLQSIIRNHVALITAGASTNSPGKSAGRGNPVTIVVDETGGLNKTQRRRIDERKRAYVELLRDTLWQLKHEGKLRALDETVAAFSLLGTMLWVARWYDPNGRLSAAALTEEILNLVLGGLLCPSQHETTQLAVPRANGRGGQRRQPFNELSPARRSQQ